MKLDNVFTVAVPVSQAWDVLTDLELIAPCMPGAKLTGVDDGVYTGKVKIKVGPVVAEYSGTARFTEKDAENYRAVIDARGRDSRGNGNANAVISAQLLAEGDSTTVAVTTDLTIAGRIAQFGSGMIREVSAKLLGQFVTCLEGKLGGEAPGATVAGAVEQAAPAAAATDTDPDGVDQAAPAAAATDTDVDAVDSAGEVAAAAPAAAGEVAVPALSSAGAFGVATEPAPIDLVAVAGGAISRRLVPAVMGVVMVAALIYLCVRL